MISIFGGRNLSEVTYEDVEIFCKQQLEENQFLDYKESVSPSLLKTICAFANTVGGWIVIGVKDDKDKPVLPVKGLVAGVNYRQQIVNMLVEGMHPISVPEIKECVSDNGKKMLVVLYVEESKLAPHWTKDDKLYIRISDRTKTDDRERLAHSNEWEQLRNRRAWSEELRDSSLGVLSELFNQFRDIGRTSPATFSTPKMHFDKLKITIGPLYARGDLYDVQKAVDLCMTKSVDVLNYSPGQLPATHIPIRTFQNGAYVVEVGESIAHDYFFAMDTRGYMILIIHIVEKLNQDTGHENRIVRLGKVLSHIGGIMRYSQGIYQELGFAGNLQLRTQILTKPGTLLLPEKLISGSNTEPANVPGAFSDLQTMRTQVLADEIERNNIIFAIGDNLKYAFNAPYIERDHMQDLLSRSTPRAQLHP